MATLDRVDGLATDLPVDDPRLVLDVADLNDRSTREVLAWFEAQPSRGGRLLLIRSHGAVRTESSPSRGLSPENLRRLRALKGVVGLSVGPPHIDSPGELRSAVEAAAAMPLGNRPGYEGIAIGTDFLRLDQTLEPFKNAWGVIDWLAREFPAEVAESIAYRTARELLLRLSGIATPSADPPGDVSPV